MVSDEQLIIAIQGGDISSFETLVIKYQNRLIRFTSQYVDSADAEDIAQNTFIKIYKNLSRVDTTKKFSTYLYEIAKNEAISFLRKHKREVPLDDEMLDTRFQMPEDTGVIRSAVEKLEDRYKKVIKLYYFEELPYDQIAMALKLPINTIRTHLRRAKAELKKLIQYD